MEGGREGSHNLAGIGKCTYIYRCNVHAEQNIFKLVQYKLPK